ncbi:hypothetical protein RvY_08985-2 [Ramazzottius varieornatus]|uniref:Chitin-binding type-2 domain-containing protein n=1 Tax=Ramazzottius varieornatus TaxID=947166 RepID=A0A1D1VFR5_RAMVA|nr:hypothetical protein RvY_08985-2 [Ramazzottius varieornatus]
MVGIIWRKGICDILLHSYCQVILTALLLIVTQTRCDSLICPSKFGYFPDPTDCQGYYICTFGTAKVRKCGPGLQYKTTTQTCDVVKASSADCEQDEGRALRPKYTGPTMKTAEPAAPAPAAPSKEISMAPTSGSYESAPTDAPIATTKAYPIFPFQSVEDSQPAYQASNARDPAQPDAAASQYQQGNPSQSLSITTRRPIIDQYLQDQQQSNPGKGLAAKRPYDFWQPPTTTSSWRLPAQNSANYGYNATQGPIAAQTKAKPFRDPSVFGNRPTFRPLKGAATRAPPVAPPPPPEQPAPDQQQPASPPSDPQYSRNSQPQDTSTNQQYSRPSQQQSTSAKFAVKQPDLPLSTGNRYQQPDAIDPGKFQYPQDPDNVSPGDSNGPASNPRLNWNTDRSSGQSTDDRWQANADSPPTMDNAASQQGSSPPVPPSSGSKRTNEPNRAPPRDKNFVAEKINRGSPSGSNVVIPTDTAMSQCSAERCQLPDCYCGSTNIPGGLSMADTPQMIILSFDAGKTYLSNFARLWKNHTPKCQ